MDARYKRSPAYFKRRDEEKLLHYVGRRILAVKSVEALAHHSEKSTLSRKLNWWDLILLGIGGIIGTGIFVLSGKAAATNAGPAVIISFIIASLVSLLAALSYSEMSAMIPISGSAYTYAYATMGELIAWIIGWDLILEYMVGSATVAVGWSAYFVTFFREAFGVHFGTKWTTPLIYWNETDQTLGISEDGGFNVPGFLIVMICTAVLFFGIRESAWFNNIIVAIKVTVILIFIFAGIKWVDPNNWSPFVPERTDADWRHFGVGGVFAASTQIFFAYIGFDAVTTAALECKNTERDLPIGIIGSLLISTILYIGVALIMTGVTSYTLLGDASPITTVAETTGQTWLVILLALGALAGLTSVILIGLLGQPRIFYSMGMDGLFPKIFSKIHPRFKTPWFPTILSGTVTALLGGFFPIDILGNLTSVGTLFAFFLVHIGVIILRFTRPDVDRPFRIPGPSYSWMFFPISGAITSLMLIAVCEPNTLWRLLIWLIIGLIVYSLYGFRHSTISEDDETSAQNDNNLELSPRSQPLEGDEEVPRDEFDINKSQQPQIV